MTHSSHDLSEQARRASAAFRAAEERAGTRSLGGTDRVPVQESRGAGLWILTTLLAIGGLGAVLYTRTDLFHPERRAAREVAREAARARAQAEAEANSVKAGDVVIDSEPGEAAVWLLLGRTPVDSPVLSAGAVHQLRLEHDGYAPGNVNVTGARWTGAGDQMRAAVSVELAPAAPGAIAPAAPPAPAAPSTGREGRGVIRVESSPPGAHAYLLIGFTPDVRFRGVRAGQGYELKVAKDGYAPGFVVIRPEDWRTEAGALRRQVEGAAQLAPLPKK